MNPKFFDRFTSGVLIGWIAAMCLAALIDSKVSDRIAQNAFQFAGILAAVSAALLALMGVSRQISHKNEEEERARIAKLRACKAVLPLALSDICKVSQNGIYHCWNGYNLLTASSFNEYRTNSFIDLKVSDEVLAILRDFVRYSRDTDGEKISLILQEYQVFLSRWRGRFETPDYFKKEPLERRCEHTTSWAYLYALSSSVFAYARGETEEIQAPDYQNDDVASALRIATVIYGNEQSFETFLDVYQKRYDRVLRATP